MPAKKTLTKEQLERRRAASRAYYRKHKQECLERSKEYKRRHNYMAIPGEKIPYSAEEIAAIEERYEHKDRFTREELELLVRQLAKRYNRSVCGIWSWIRVHFGNYVSPTEKKRRAYSKMLGLKASGQWDYRYNCPASHVKFIPKRSW